MIVTSYARNVKNLDDEIKITKRRPIIAPAIAVQLLIKVDMLDIDVFSTGILINLERLCYLFSVFIVLDNILTCLLVS